jgi:hypothetical protein
MGMASLPNLSGLLRLFRKNQKTDLIEKIKKNN